MSPNTPSATGRGNPQASEWLDQLRARFQAIAARRVPAAVVEDLVQEALVIVVERGVRTGAAAPFAFAGAVDDLPPLAWSFQVLRNTIGNWYQRERTRRAAADPASVAHDQLRAASAPTQPLTPLEALERTELASLLGEALRALAADSQTCARYLRGLAEGEKPAAIAGREGVEEAALYRRIYRCREKLRALLAARGILV